MHIKLTILKKNLDTEMNNPEDYLSEEEKLVKTYYTCTYEVCKGRGECYFNEMGKAACKCYRQYYQGVNCTVVPNLCEPSQMEGITWVPNCNKDNVQACFATFGMNYCECQDDFVDRTCNQLYDWRELHGPSNMAIQFPRYPIALFKLEPEVLRSLHIDFGVGSHQDVSYYQFAIEGVSYLVEKDEFKEKSANELSNRKTITTLLGQEVMRK